MPDKCGLNPTVSNMLLAQMAARQCDALALKLNKQGHQIIKQLQIGFVAEPMRPTRCFFEGAKNSPDAGRRDGKELQDEIPATD